MTYDSSLSLMNGNNYGYNQYSNPYSSYGNYNSYGNYGMYGGYGYGGITDVQTAKTDIANQYDIYSTQQGYGNMQNVENMNYAQRSNTIAELLREGRGADAMQQFNTLCGELKASSLYSNYSDAQIKAIAQNIYQRSTGESLTEAVRSTSSSSFAKGLQAGIPIIGTFFTDSTSKEDMLSEITDTPKRPQDQVAKSAGATISGAASGAAIGAGVGAIFGGIGAVPGAIGGAIIGGVVGLFKSLFK